MTAAQKKALKWLAERGGDGIFDKHGVLLAAGESAPFRRVTWNALRDLGKVKFYGGKSGRARLKVSEAA